MNLPREPDPLAAILRDLARVIDPLTHQRRAAGFTQSWNGERWVPAVPSLALAAAVGWKSRLNALASFVELQREPVSEGQVRHIEQLLLGGMGSLADACFEPEAIGLSEIIAESGEKLLDDLKTRARAVDMELQDKLARLA